MMDMVTAALVTMFGVDNIGDPLDKAAAVPYATLAIYALKVAALELLKVSVPKILYVVPVFDACPSGTGRVRSKPQVPLVGSVVIAKAD
jgi:hypothetical protein